jgi:hypothetical protein
VVHLHFHPTELELVKIVPVFLLRLVLLDDLSALVLYRRLIRRLHLLTYIELFNLAVPFFFQVG